MPLALVLNLTIFLSVLAVMTLLLVLVTTMYRPPQRRCPQCDRDVPQTKRTCSHCGYRFAFFRFTR